MDLQLKGKTALVTGGSEGIGKGIALAARQGRRRRRDLRAPQGAARSRPPPRSPRRPAARSSPSRPILRKDADAKNFIEQGHKALGRVDIMVNNAGSAAGGVIEHLTEDDWEKGLQLKFMGYVRCLRYVLPIMVKQGGGRVVNLIGNDGVKPSYWEICPGAANAAGQNLTLSLAGQYGKHGISFCAVNPGTGAHRALGRTRAGHVARHETSLRGGRPACAVVDPDGPHRRGRGGGESGRHARFAADAHGQRHADRDRRRPGEIADGSPARPQVSARSRRVMRGLDPRIHQMKDSCEVDGLPGQEGVYARLRRLCPAMTTDGSVPNRRDAAICGIGAR